MNAFTTVSAVHPLVNLKGLPTREELAQARALLDAYERELRDQEDQALMNSIEAARQACLKKAKRSPSKRAEQLTMAGKYAKVLEILATPAAQVVAV
ncbi:conserved hypothetical protein [Pseudomonas sp. 8BK]|uniref:hypothetical protein n=1 Tax=Pseudomonas sp. 8BK TaxID=2653164 RepID=UPI0012F3138F|nr:hypothetical protein [Pseudomonas sp. 8BK]VXB57206.1 conserved hypothetical protein [Pseudomonas sp. 8BK]